MTDKELIKAEIERRMDDLYPLLPDATAVLNEAITPDEANLTGKYLALESLLAFINSLPEEPVSEDLNKAAIKFAQRAYSPFDDAYEVSRAFQNDVECFKAGAQWQKQQLENETE